MQRQREREAARIALQKVLSLPPFCPWLLLMFRETDIFVLLHHALYFQIEKTVDIDENRAVLKDLEMLACAHPAIDASINSVDGGALSPLERLGLFMKNDDLEEEDI